MSPAQLRTHSNPDEWSANEVLAHLRSCADVWGSYIRQIIDEDRPTIRAVSPRRWVHKTDYPELEFAASLRAFTTQRAELLAVLGGLPAEGWSRAATVMAVGRVYGRTVRDFAERLAHHERPHVKQIEQTVMTMQRDV